jgi:hypothetical protein
MIGKIADAFKAVRSRLPGVDVGDVLLNQDDIGFSAWIIINGARFRTWVSDRDIARAEHDRSAKTR